MKKIRLNINNKEVFGIPGQTVLEVCKENDISIPTLCYDERTEIYGSCGLCMVEIEGSLKLFKSCATEIADGMVISTDTERVKESRKTNLELLLSKHIGDCRPPCKLACPAQTDCQGYVGLIANGEYEAAIELIKERLPLPAAIGRVCPHPCEDACRRQLIDESVSILWLKRFVADMDLGKDISFIPEIKPDTGRKIGIIGGGPGGLTAAFFLRKEGHDVTIYDAMPKLGGMLRYGIPEYRLPKDVLDDEIDTFAQMGIKFVVNTRIGKDITFSTVREKFDAVYVALGAWTSSDLRCEGKDIEGVVGGIDFLRKVVTNEPFEMGEKVAIVGGGNTAMDACRTAVRLGAKEVYNVYRRTKNEMPAEEIEIVEAEEEGVIFKNLTNPIEVIPGEDGKVQKVRLQIMELGEPDASGRRRPVPVEGQEEVIDVDNIIVAIGQGIDPSGFEDLELTKWNTIVADTETFATNLEGVFAGGDCVNDGASIAIQAIGDAENAVPFINAYLENKEMTYNKPYYVTREDLDEEYFADRIKALRPPMGHISPDDRKTTFEEFVAGYTPEQAKEEAMRCLECGCHDYFECKLVDYANEYDVEPERLAGENKEIEFNDDHPYIMRDPNKCILCGLCVRVCDELMGISALGLVERGFDTLVLPSLGMPLQETGCISCGQCINVCPTGALGERTQVAKPVPVDTVKTKTVCGYCSAGCEMVVESMGNTIIKAVPVNESRNNGIMCGRGRFGTDRVQHGERITKPYIRKNGELQEAEWYDAFVYTIKKAQSLKAKYGEKGLVLSTGAKNTLEDVFSINKFAEALDVPVTSHDDIDNEIYSMKDYNEITGSDVLLVFDLAPSTNPLIMHKLREAKKAGATIFAINSEETSVHKIGEEITGEEGLTLAKEVLAYLQDENADVSAQAKQWGSTYQSAKQKMVIAGSNGVEDLAFAIAKAAGQQQVPRQGVLKVYSKCNTVGLMAMGVKSIDTMDYKGLMIFGEDVEKLADGIEFLMVQDTHMTDTALQADVVFPALSFPEINGSFLNGEGRLMKVKKTVKTPIPLKNWELPLELLKIMEIDLGFRCYREIGRDIKKEYPVLKDVKEDECIKIECAVKEIPEIVDASFEVVMTTDYLMNKMNEELFAVIKH